MVTNIQQSSNLIIPVESHKKNDLADNELKNNYNFDISNIV